jgi:cytochrome c2
MTYKASMTVLVALLGANITGSANAYDGDWKRGRVYYRQVCTTCHTGKMHQAVAPNDKTKADWTAYLAAGRHDKGKDTVWHYFSKPYRASIKATNKAAEKFADTPDQELIDDVRAFLIRSAKDGDAPAGCS